MKRQPDLFQVLQQEMRRAASRAAWTAGNNSADQDADDRDDHQQLDEREARPPFPRSDPAWPCRIIDAIPARVAKPQTAATARGRTRKRSMKCAPNKPTATRPLSLATGRRSRDGRSSGSRASAGPAFSPPRGSRQWPNRKGQPRFTRLQRRGRSGFAPEFPVRRLFTKVADHQRTS